MTGRSVVITAAASGIGLAIAKAFAAAGDRVHICDIDGTALSKVTESIPGLTSTVCDISDRAAVEGFIAEAATTLGGIDILINNAGIAGPTATVETIDPDDWERVLAVNLTGTFNVTRLSIPYLKQSEAGVIIFMSSLAGRLGYLQRSPYATVKRGIIGFAESLALEVGEYGVRVNTIAPGAVEGDRVRSVLQARADASGRTIEEVTEQEFASQALKRFVDPTDIAALCVFLASDSGKSISGQTIPIDGGARIIK